MFTHISTFQRLEFTPVPPIPAHSTELFLFFPYSIFAFPFFLNESCGFHQRLHIYSMLSLLLCLKQFPSCFAFESVSHSVVSDSCDPMDSSPKAPLSLKVSRQEYWSEQPFPSPGDLPNLEIKSQSPALQADSLPSEPPGKPVTHKSVFN